jgi:hypothetical protein
MDNLQPVQENLLKGGLPGRSRSGHATATPRAASGIDQCEAMRLVGMGRRVRWLKA